MDFRDESVADLAEAVRERKVSARELAAAAVERIESLDGELNAFVALDGDAALAQAAAVDERVAAGDPVGPLAGIPLAVKDLEDAAGFRTTHGSPVHADDAPAPQDSTLVARLRAAGCVVIGKTNTPEFGHMADTTNAVFGATRNPWNPARSPGGSSGGSAAALAAGMVPLATGSDGGGSIRIPSAVCGLSGHKCSLGRVPSGAAEPPNWRDLSVRGPMALRIRDVALALDAVVGPDPTDLRSLPAPPEPWSPHLHEPTLPARVGWSPTLGYATVDDEVLAACETAVRVFEGLGVEVVEVPVVWPTDPVDVWFALASTFNLRTLGEHRGTEVWDDFDPMLRAAMDWAEATVGVLDFIRADDEVHRLNLRLAEVFEDVDLLLTPTTAGQTPESGGLGSINGEPDVNWVRMTYGFNLTRNPAGSVCAGYCADGMPIGLQVVGPQHDDLGVLRALAALEDALALEPRAPVP